MAIGEGSPWFCDEITKTLILLVVTRWEGVKIASSHLWTTLMSLVESLQVLAFLSVFISKNIIFYFLPLLNFFTSLILTQKKLYLFFIFIIFFAFTCTGGPHYIREIGTPKICSHIMNSHIKRSTITVN